MFEWELRDPWFLALLPLALLVYWSTSQSPSALGYSSLQLLEKTPKSWRQRLSLLPALLTALATVVLIVALARPRTPERETRVSRDGIAIMMVVDLSSSMNARDLVEGDISIDRLEVVKDVFVDFVLGNQGDAGQGRADDLIGLVTFAGYADSVCPLTLDHGNLVNIVHDLQIVTSRNEDGTALGDGLGLAVERLRRSTAKSRVVILLTDGVHNAGIIPPLKAAELAKEYDIKIYSIGAGTNGMAPIPSADFFGRATLRAQQVNIDEETLKQVADKTGGKYFRAQNREALAEIYAEIDQLERTEVTELRYLRYHEHFPQCVMLGMGLLATASVLAGSVFRKLP